MMHTKKSLTGIKGLSEAKVDKICEAAEKTVSFGYFTGSEALLKRMAEAQITTKSQALDELLAGGIYTKAINNAFRKFRCGNTQLAHRLCVTTQGMDVNLYMPGHQVTYQSLPMADAAYPETTMAISPATSLMGQPSDTMTAARKRNAPGSVLERTVEKRHKRMIKNRESVACSTTRKQAYNNELENKVSRLEEENERRRRKKLKPSSPMAVKQEKIAAK